MGGGATCAGCTIVVGLVDQLAQIHQQTFDQVLDEICTWLPSELQPECYSLVVSYGPLVVKFLENDETADRVCQLLDICTNATCHLFPLPSSESTTKFDSRYIPKVTPPNLGWIPPWQLIANHEPVLDVDGMPCSRLFESERSHKATSTLSWKPCEASRGEVAIAKTASQTFILEGRSLISLYVSA